MVVTAKPVRVHVGIERGRRHGVGGDASFADVYGEGAGEHLDRPLGHGVADDVGSGVAGGSGGNVDDATAVVHPGQGMPSHEERGALVECDQTVEILDSDALERSAPTDSGVVDEDVEPSVEPETVERGVELPHQLFRPLGSGQVGLDRSREAPGSRDAVDHRSGGRPIGSVVDDYGGTGGGHRICDGRPDAAAGPGDQRDSSARVHSY